MLQRIPRRVQKFVEAPRVPAKSETRSKIHRSSQRFSEFRDAFKNVFQEFPGIMKNGSINRQKVRRVSPCLGAFAMEPSGRRVFPRICRSGLRCAPEKNAFFSFFQVFFGIMVPSTDEEDASSAFVHEFSRVIVPSTDKENTFSQGVCYSWLRWTPGENALTRLTMSRSVWNGVFRKTRFSLSFRSSSV